ncbi:MAG: hypothetical protein ACOX3A_07755 [bacterium]
MKRIDQLEYAELKPECVERIKQLEDNIKKYSGEDVYVLAFKR